MPQENKLHDSAYTKLLPFKVLLPTYEPLLSDLIEAPSEQVADCVDKLRGQLREDMAKRVTEKRQYYDHVFQLQLVLAQSWPVNLLDKAGLPICPITLDVIVPENLVACSSGHVFDRDALIPYFQACWERPRHPVTREKLTRRDAQHFKAVGVLSIAAPRPVDPMQPVNWLLSGIIFGSRMGVVLGGIFVYATLPMWFSILALMPPVLPLAMAATVLLVATRSPEKALKITLGLTALAFSPMILGAVAAVFATACVGGAVGGLIDVVSQAATSCRTFIVTQWRSYFARRAANLQRAELDMEAQVVPFATRDIFQAGFGASQASVVLRSGEVPASPTRRQLASPTRDPRFFEAELPPVTGAQPGVPYLVNLSTRAV